MNPISPVNWKSHSRGAALTLSVVLASAVATGQPATPLPEAPSTVQATYVEPSATRALAAGEKIGRLFARNQADPYVLQRLTKRTYWFQRQHYGTIFYVGEKGVLVFDPLEARGEFIRQAVTEVTKLPVAAVVYSHDHADHIGDAKGFVDAAAKAGADLRIIASQATARKMAFLASTHPRPTETVLWPKGSFQFEDLTVEMHGFVRAAHADDHSAWLLVGEKVVHVPDQINPDQPPFWAFAGSESFIYYEANVEQVGALDWTYLSGGHGNVGSKADIAFYRAFLGDLKQAVGGAMQESPWGDGIDPATVNAHTVYLSSWLSAVAKRATDALRPKYGAHYGFEAATPRNAEMVAMAMFSYR